MWIAGVIAGFVVGAGSAALVAIVGTVAFIFALTDDVIAAYLSLLSLRVGVAAAGLLIVIVIVGGAGAGTGIVTVILALALAMFGAAIIGKEIGTIYWTNHSDRIGGQVMISRSRVKKCVACWLALPAHRIASPCTECRTTNMLDLCAKCKPVKLVYTCWRCRAKTAYHPAGI